jgi:hypothetical protein
MNMLSWQQRIPKYIIHVVERPFVKGAFTPPPASLEIMTSVHFAIPTKEGTQQRKRMVKLQ